MADFALKSKKFRAGRGSISPSKSVICVPLVEESNPLADSTSWLGRPEPWRPCQGVGHPRQPPWCPRPPPRPPQCDFAMSLLQYSTTSSWVKVLSVPVLKACHL
eukprot:5443240-Prymnesium_polylepis.1